MKTLALLFVFVAMLAGCAAPVAVEAPSSSPAVAADTLTGVAARTHTIPEFRLQGGTVMKDVVIAYETYGKLDRSGRNAILITHGNTSSFHAAGRYARHQAAFGVDETTLGWWDTLIGPGKAFDTDKYFVVSSNMLGVPSARPARAAPTRRRASPTARISRRSPSPTWRRRSSRCWRRWV